MTFDKTAELLSDVALTSIIAHTDRTLSIMQTGLRHDAAQAFAAKQRTLIKLIQQLTAQLYTEVGLNAPNTLAELDEVLVAGVHLARSQAGAAINDDAAKKGWMN